MYVQNYNRYPGLPAQENMYIIVYTGVNINIVRHVQIIKVLDNKYNFKILSI